MQYSGVLGPLVGQPRKMKNLGPILQPGAMTHLFLASSIARCLLVHDLLLLPETRRTIQVLFHFFFVVPQASVEAGSLWDPLFVTLSSLTY